MSEADCFPQDVPRLRGFVSWLSARLQAHERDAEFGREFIDHAAEARLLGRIDVTPASIRDYSADVIYVAATHPSAAFIIHQHQVALQFCAAAGLPPPSEKAELICNANSEPGMHFRGTAIRTRSLRTYGDLASLTGSKHFCSGVSLATHFLSLVGNEAGGTTLVLVPTSRRGVFVEGDWTASGLRATGSRSLRLESVDVGADERVVIDPANLPRRWWAYGYGLIAYGAAERMRNLLIESVRSAPDATTGVEELTLGTCAVHAYAARNSLLRGPQNLSDRDADPDADGEIAAARVIAQRFAEEVCSRARPLLGGILVDETSIWSLLQRDIAAIGLVPPSPERVARFLGRLTLGLETSLLSTRVGGPA